METQTIEKTEAINNNSLKELSTSDTTTEVLRFEPKTETKLLSALNKLLKPEKEMLSEEEAIKLNCVNVIDTNNICMFVALGEEAKRTLSRFIKKDNIPREPQLIYTDNEKGLNILSKYSTEYLSRILKIFEILDTSVNIQIKTDYPITLSNKHFKVILAPKVSND